MKFILDYSAINLLKIINAIIRQLSLLQYPLKTYSTPLRSFHFLWSPSWRQPSPSSPTLSHAPWYDVRSPQTPARSADAPEKKWKECCDEKCGVLFSVQSGFVYVIWAALKWSSLWSYMKECDQRERRTQFGVDPSQADILEWDFLEKHLTLRVSPHRLLTARQRQSPKPELEKTVIKCHIWFDQCQYRSDCGSLRNGPWKRSESCCLPSTSPSSGTDQVSSFLKSEPEKIIYKRKMFSWIERGSWSLHQHTRWGVKMVSMKNHATSNLQANVWTVTFLVKQTPKRVPTSVSSVYSEDSYQQLFTHLDSLKSRRVIVCKMLKDLSGCEAERAQAVKDRWLQAWVKKKKKKDCVSPVCDKNILFLINHQRSI